ncbi:hypothetical protein A3C89_02150 [Candidatus Kaiserbacteria bacterium RIFCSPHIGHO2_02_FULL_50_50]|uniref:ABC transporter ATP-binding protein n=1 Tax=Candidatus Kaiserbacteria bacterium RIFCSPHIGHO2_02_FULL_50_50 TaxID=1798492 RepID=A0A1F6DFJ8_9BACT|nr:MAG: hypothetical protein A3C89_02150 [Candidatus Kaiserbacteria bacterium RIFCSPHIGHO2_02_FULL_50_50]
MKTIPKLSTSPWRFAWDMSLRSRGLLGLTLLLVLIGDIISGLLPYVYKIIIDGVTNANVSTALPTGTFITIWSVVYLLGFLIAVLTKHSAAVTGTRGETMSVLRAQASLMSYLFGHSHRFFSDAFSGTLGAKVSQAADGVGAIIEGAVWEILSLVLSVTIATSLMFSIDWRAGMVFLFLIVILALINIPLSSLQQKAARALADENAKVSGYSFDMLANFRSIRTFAQSEPELALFVRQNDAVRRKANHSMDMSQLVLGINSLAIIFATGVIVMLLVTGYNLGTVTAGSFVLMFAVVLNIYQELTRVGFTINRFVQTYSETAEALETLIVPQEILDAPHAESIVVSGGAIDFKDVNFSYEHTSVFKDFTLRVSPHEHLGLVGRSGAGKSTLVSLLLREFDIASGVITIDNVNIASVTQDSLRAAISIVPQEPVLFHRTLRENIAYGKPSATDAEIHDAAKKAHAHDFITALPNGYDTLVGERGTKLSGGQRQRVIIARAILKDAPILILDEATSALDSESEAAIQDALKTLMQGKTVIAIAHRLSTLKSMSRIVVIDGGTILEEGTHTELVQKDSGTYAALWSHQAGGFIQE